MHITTLNAGQSPHPPHTHPDEELMIVKEGNIESVLEGKTTPLGPGGIIFHASNQPHTVQEHRHDAGHLLRHQVELAWHAQGAAGEQMTTSHDVMRSRPPARWPWAPLAGSGTVCTGESRQGEAEAVGVPLVLPAHPARGLPQGGGRSRPAGRGPAAARGMRRRRQVRPHRVDRLPGQRRRHDSRLPEQPGAARSDLRGVQDGIPEGQGGEGAEPDHLLRQSQGDARRSGDRQLRRGPQPDQAHRRRARRHRGRRAPQQQGRTTRTTRATTRPSASRS